MKRNIVLTGGGTMGHVSPNLALIPILAQKYTEIHYIGSKNGVEKSKIEELAKAYKNLFYHSIPTTKLNRSNLFKNFSIPFILLSAKNKAKKILKATNPEVIFSKGGYVSVPVCLNAKKLNIPLVIHESDLSMGLANKIASRYASTICTTFKETASHFPNGVWTGSPVSPKLLNANKQNAVKKYHLSPALKTIAITGGSLGSVVINNAVETILPKLASKYNIIHITGKNKRVNFSHPNYHQLEFADNIGDIFKASDLVISRAGSNTIFELALLKIPMLLIPLSKKSSRGDQIENAEYFKKLGIAEVILEEELKNLETTLDETINHLSYFKSNLINEHFSNGLNTLLEEINKASKR